MTAAPSPVLHIDALHVQRANDGVSGDVLRGVSLSVGRGEICALMGVSGAGKSTVLRAAVALEPFNAGHILIDGVSLHPGPVPRESALRLFRRKVGMVFQQHALFTHLTAQQNVMLAPVHAVGASGSSAAEAAHELLTSLGVAHRASAYPSQLSGGEAQRVAIARALALDPPLLLMDEPTAALDPARRGALAETLRALAAGGRTLVITTHDLTFARAVADTVAVLADGMVVERGPIGEVLDHPSQEATRLLMAHD
ncbi:amino acid ABC transporter ATP-binding protein [Gemmatimonas sp.]|jgi:polar amino acid transport system ATP-binding protein|uniref:amino acid ABC transporter ATP-binding protein n=1 Tax=Gemmatimonas sp. TaxID=1962908 RepID=UPI0037C1A98A